MKHYIGRIEEVNGDMEYSDKFLFTTKGSPQKYAEKVAKDWRGSTRADWDKELLGWWADNGSLILAADWREIPKEDFEVLKKYIAVL
jgi:hypothetical protein